MEGNGGGMEWNGVEWSGMEEEWSGTEWKSAVYIYLRSNLTAGAPGSTFFFTLNPDVERLSRLLNKIEMLFKYCPLHQRIKPSDK